MSKHKKHRGQGNRGGDQSHQGAQGVDIIEQAITHAPAFGAAALESLQNGCETVKKSATAGVQYADQKVRAKPYQFIGAALALGWFVGARFKRRG